jgi:protein SCO1/2
MLVRVKRRSSILLFLIIITLNVAGCSSKATDSSSEAIVINQPVSDAPNLASLEDRGQLPDFSLSDQKGRSVKLSDLKGHVWVADFFFTHCKGACPMMTSHMGELQEMLSPAGLRLVSITVDPDNDTPKVLTEFAMHAGAKDDSWLFLTGDKSKIIDLSVNGFHLGASAEPSTHSQRLVLVDRDGHIRGYYRNEEKDEIEQLKRNAAILLKEGK